jgi:hypothetical protein
MNNVLLGIIALSVLTMAVIQVAAMLVAARAAKRLGDLAERIEQDIRPIVSNLQSVSADAARTTALAAATVERADRLFQDAAQRVEQTLSALPSLIESARDGFNVLAGLRALLGAFRDMRTTSRRRRPATVEEEDALFIG